MKTFDDIFEDIYKTWGASLLSPAPPFIMKEIAKQYAEEALKELVQIPESV